MAKKKKKKRSGAKKPSYAKGKKVETSSARSKAAPRKAQAKPADKKAPQKKSSRTDGQPEQARWNLVKSGTPEMKIFLWLLILLALGTLLHYPLWADVSLEQYQDLKKTYSEELAEFENKYPTEEERKEHEEEKPEAPKKPKFGDFLLYQAFILALQGALMAFLGLNISRRTDLETPILDGLATKEREVTAEIWDLAKYGIPGGIAALLPLLAIPLLGRTDIVSSFQASSETETIKYPVWKYVLSSVNDGLQYQMMFVFVVFSFFAWIFLRYYKKRAIDPHYLALGAAFLFSVGLTYLNVATRSGGGQSISTGALVLFVLLNSLPVLILGYLYWKKGLEYSLLAAIVSFGLYPFLASLIAA